MRSLLAWVLAGWLVTGLGGVAGMGNGGVGGEPEVEAGSDLAGELDLDWLEEAGLRPRLWDHAITLRTWAGYKDNPQLSSLNAVESAFWAVGGEWMAYRLPADGWEVTVFAMAEHVGYGEGNLDPESIALMDARVRRNWGNGWWAGLGAEYLYLHQIFDASELEGVPGVVRAEGHLLGGRPRLGWSPGDRWEFEWGWEPSRQWLAQPLDGFWEMGTVLRATRKLGARDEVGGLYRYRGRWFDTRAPRGAAGQPMEGSLFQGQHEVEGMWRRTWGADGAWRATLRSGWARSLDNGGGYYDYDRALVSGVLRYASDRWEVRTEARWRWYRYPVQPAGALDGPRRRRMDGSLHARGEWRAGRRLRLFAEYGLELSDENVTASDYRAQSIGGGMSFDL
ncbi:MAG: hypothetical protein KF833_08405 [Verrucomicrobiae bacterium]|nr:hypothetical protein [Verrucomicrobiae bacterium]